MDEKGDDGIGMDEAESVPEKKEDKAADRTAGQLQDKPVERPSLKAGLAEMKARVSGAQTGKGAMGKGMRNSLS